MTPPQDPQHDSGDVEFTIGGPVDDFKVSIRFGGAGLDPAELTARLGIRPSAARRAGETGITAPAAAGTRSGIWVVDAPAKPGASLDVLIGSLLDNMTDDLAAWRDLSARFGGNVFCGLFLRQRARGTELSCELLRRIADRGLRLGLDIYYVHGLDAREYV